MKTPKIKSPRKTAVAELREKIATGKPFWVPTASQCQAALTESAKATAGYTSRSDGRGGYNLFVLPTFPKGKK